MSIQNAKAAGKYLNPATGRFVNCRIGSDSTTGKMVLFCEQAGKVVRIPEPWVKAKKKK